MFYLPGVCTHTDTKGKQRKTRVRNIINFFEKNTIFNEHPVSRCLGKIVFLIKYKSGKFSSKGVRTEVLCEEENKRRKSWVNFRDATGC